MLRFMCADSLKMCAYVSLHVLLGTKIIIGDKEHCLRRYVKHGVLTTVEVIMSEPIKKGEEEEAGEEKEEANVEDEAEANEEDEGEASVEDEAEANEEDEGEASVEDEAEANEEEASDHAHHTHAPHKSMYTYFMKTFFFSFTHIIF